MPAKRTKSKRQSDANSVSRWPRDVVLFVDRCLGRFDVPDALRAAGATVEVHHDHFSDDSADPEWLPAVGKKGWLVLTNDRHFRHNYLELVAMFKGNVKAFVFSGKDVKGDKIGAIFVKSLRRIYDFAERFDAPFIANVSEGSGVSMPWHKSQLFDALHFKAAQH
jgi:hypothetical protein